MRDEIDDETWYGMQHLPAMGRLFVRVRWAGYRVTATSEVDRRGRRHWHEVRGRELVPLAAKPEAWQPLDAGKWRWPNGAMAPEPLVVQVVPRIVTIGGMAFDAVAAAAEMESDRDDARARRDEPVAEGPQWWRDVARVVYEPMGAISREHGEARIMRHLIVERSLPLAIKRQKSNALVLVDLKRTLADVYGAEADHDWVPPLVAQPEDWRDFETVMRWFAEVMPYAKEMRVMRGRMLAPPISYVELGEQMKRSHEHVRRLYEDAITALVEAGNRPPRRARARLAELQERNREARRT